MTAWVGGQRRSLPSGICKRCRYGTFGAISSGDGRRKGSIGSEVAGVSGGSIRGGSMADAIGARSQRQTAATSCAGNRAPRNPGRRNMVLLIVAHDVLQP